MKSRIPVFVAAAVLAVCCVDKRTEKFAALPFPDIRIPSMLESGHDMAEYLAMNYWNMFADTSRNFPCDSSLVSGVKTGIVEQKFVEWIALIESIGADAGGIAVARLYDMAVACERNDGSSNIFETFVHLSQKYLYDPNSRMRNEDLYFHFVSRLASYEGLDPLMKGKYERDARLCSMNRTGFHASDFRFYDRTGRLYTLYGIDAEYTLLFFSNPGCAACKDIINVLTSDPVISGLVSSGRLAVVNVYIDEDIAEWYGYMPQYPSEWYNGYDPDGVIREDTLYNVRAIPSLYLLDSCKTVLMKDAPEQKVVAFLRGLASQVKR